jgi:sugar phosphate isomerase/epimerase
MGFREVELAGTYGMTPEAFKMVLDSVGLTASAMHVSYDRFHDDLTAVLDEAEMLGVDYVGLAWIPHPEGEPFSPDMARSAAADFNAWGEAASERGLTFYYHNHGYEFQPAADGTIPFDLIVGETNPEFVSFEMDVYWVAHPGVDPAALLRQYPDRWKLMHVKDMTPGTPTGDFSGHAPAEAQIAVGMGQIDYPAVLEAADEIGIDRYYIEDETTDPIANIPMSITFMESVTFPEAGS